MDGSDEEKVMVQKKTKKRKESNTEPGILYLSRIPTRMNVKKIRQIFTSYGETDKIFLQPDEKATGNKKNRLFSEGWIEMGDKRLAKRIALSLNNTNVGGKRRTPWFDDIWNIKYLPKFKWVHLNERLAYERAVFQQRLRTEVSQAKRETNFYLRNVDKNKVMKRIEKKSKNKAAEASEDQGESKLDTRQWTFKQNLPEDEVIARKKRKTDQIDKDTTSKKDRQQRESSKKVGLDKSFLQSIFSGGLVAGSDNS